MAEHPELLAALQANLALLREVGLRYDVATDPRRGCDSYENTMQTPEDVAERCADMLPMVQEQLRVLLLSTKQAVVDVVTVYQGTVNSADVRIAEVLRPAILANTPQHDRGAQPPLGRHHAVQRRHRSDAQTPRRCGPDEHRAARPCDRRRRRFAAEHGPPRTGRVRRGGGSPWLISGKAGSGERKQAEVVTLRNIAAGMVSQLAADAKANE